MSEWQHHSPEFVDLREYDDGRPIVVMELVPPDADVLRDAWNALTRLWLELPPHANILDAVERSGRLGLFVRFAAIAWRREPLLLEDETRTTRAAAALGLQLCYAMSFLEAEVDAAERGWFTCPMAKVDIEGQVRLAFLPVAHRHPHGGRFVAPEVREHWPRCEEPGLVYLIGIALDELTEAWPEDDAPAPPRSPITPIIDRCLEPSTTKRYETIADVRRALRAVSGVKHALRQKSDLDEWRQFEEAIGRRVIRKPVRRHVPWADRPHQPTDRPRARPVPPPTPGREAHEQGKALFRAGRLDDARASFERALALEPTFVEAMLLRREVDRCASRARAEAGHAWPVRHDIDEALAKSAHLEAMLAQLDDDS